MTSHEIAQILKHRRVRVLLAEPTVHFALLAVLLFLVSGIRDQGREVVEVNRREIEWRILAAASTAEDSLTELEEAEVARAYIDDLILAEEAKRLGLDDDERITTILSQKLRHVWSGEIVPPTPTELEAYYAKSGWRYSQPASVTVDRVLLTDDRSNLHPALWAHELGSEDRMVSEGVEHTVLRRVSSDDLSWALGEEITAKIFSAEDGEWVGPIATIRGAYWFRVTGRFEPVVPPLDSVLETVRMDWIGERESSLMEERLAELRKRYAVELVDEGSEP